MQKFLLMLTVLFCAAGVLQAQNTDALKPAPAQPIAFNHKLHIETAKMSCNDCHEPRGTGMTVAMPQPPKCMRCHATVATDKPDIKRLAEAAKNEDPILWVRVYRIPSFVSFSHKTHTDAGSTCEQCHGPVAERTAIAQEKDTSMGSCIACHQAKGAPSTCDTCHAIMSMNRGFPANAEGATLARLGIHATDHPTFKATPEAKSTGGLPQLAAVANFLFAPPLSVQ
ncbi:MAG: cytochrome c3 family protein [Edaphobacter sp.]|uniref:cytochrome c3 family protein n=1 Tax=Edaphobacter sp. TaxID=1934404 RepID=UPI0023888368|nr:cytochrome c3 family protein [Edaphobacter sp.]MDE1177424.1 cytochrome c3 family protein [Edaphobacter sp.]